MHANTEVIVLRRTDSEDPAFRSLVSDLDADLAIRNGVDVHAFYAQFNGIDMIRHVVVAYDGPAAVGCGAVKPMEPGTMEIKRMYTRPEARGRGVASMILGELERWAFEMGNSRTVLETGLKQREAIHVYTKSGYVRTPNYGQYAGIENSICFEKRL
jgi:GNAT superfamily N-acetyltransferase